MCETMRNYFSFSENGVMKHVKVDSSTPVKKYFIVSAKCFGATYKTISVEQISNGMADNMYRIDCMIRLMK